jgi:hypothetical protein
MGSQEWGLSPMGPPGMGPGMGSVPIFMTSHREVLDGPEETPRGYYGMETA